MPRHILTIEEQIRGIRRAIASPRTPPQLKRALRARREALIAKTRPKRKTRAKSNHRPGLLEWLGL